MRSPPTHPSRSRTNGDTSRHPSAEDRAVGSRRTASPSASSFVARVEAVGATGDRGPGVNAASWASAHEYTLRSRIAALGAPRATRVKPRQLATILPAAFRAVKNTGCVPGGTRAIKNAMSGWSRQRGGIGLTVRTVAFESPTLSVCAETVSAPTTNAGVVPGTLEAQPKSTGPAFRVGL